MLLRVKISAIIKYRHTGFGTYMLFTLIEQLIRFWYIWIWPWPSLTQQTTDNYCIKNGAGYTKMCQVEYKTTELNGTTLA